MFGNKKDQKVEKTKSKVETIIGTGTKIEGDIYTKGSLRIEGEIEGHIKAEGDLFIGEGGKVKTEIEAQNIIVAGTASGNITASHKVEILATGKVSGDIKTKTLKIEEGANFDGSSTVIKNKGEGINSLKREVNKAKKEAAATNQ